MIKVKVVIFMSIVLIAAHAASTCILGLPKKIKPERLCLEIRKPCLASKYPCCPLSYQCGITSPKPLMCFKFGKGICQEYGSINYLNEYNRLLQQLNETNFQCMTSGLPCCTLMYQNTYIGLGLVPTTCFKFGKGICQVNQSINNFNEYNRLVSQLNSTNFHELRITYWSSIPTSYACPQKVTIELKSV